jgi:hypothetical protein
MRRKASLKKNGTEVHNIEGGYKCKKKKATKTKILATLKHLPLL